MKNHIRIFLLFGALTLSYTLSGQNMAAMRINEVQSVNTDGFIDDYGCRSGWIELFNTSYGTVDIGGCFLTDDPERSHQVHDSQRRCTHQDTASPACALLCGQSAGQRHIPYQLRYSECKTDSLCQQ